MLREVRRRACRRMMPVVGALVLLAGCGEPPAPPSTAPPEPTGSPSLVASASAYPPGALPTIPTTLPTGVLPPVTLPPATVPTLPYTPPTTTTTPRPTTTTSRTPGPPPAPRCTAGPSAGQVVAVVKGTSGIPDNELKVIEGPFCSGAWQFATIEIVARDSEEKFEPLFVVTTGTPPTLQLVEAGTDVCSVRVQNDAPTGIRVRACGS